MELIEANVSTIDFLEGAFYRIDPMTEEALVKDFALYFKDHLSKQALKVFDRLGTSEATVSDAMRAIEIFERIIEDYNVLKLISSKTVAENTPSATMELWFCAALSLLYIGLSFVFFITSLVDFINTLKGKKSKANLSVCAFALAAALGSRRIRLYCPWRQSRLRNYYFPCICTPLLCRRNGVSDLFGRAAFFQTKASPLHICRRRNGLGRPRAVLHGFIPFERHLFLRGSRQIPRGIRCFHAGLRMEFLEASGIKSRNFRFREHIFRFRLFGGRNLLRLRR